MYIDTHCHLSKKDYMDIEQVLSDNYQNGVRRMVISSSTPEDIEEVLNFISCYDNIYGSIGYHPEVASTIMEDDISYLEDQLKNNKVVAIGEIGLDYHYTKENKEHQKSLFRKQLVLAQKYHLPVIIHSRDATEETITILKEYALKGIIHCFSGSLETARQYISMGYYLGIGGVITFKNSHLKDVIKEIPLEHIVLETDSPYLSPEPFRGKQNSSKNIPIIAKFIAQVKQVSVETVEEITTRNASLIFDFTK